MVKAKAFSKMFGGEGRKGLLSGEDNDYDDDDNDFDLGPTEGSESGTLDDDFPIAPTTGRGGDGSERDIFAANFGSSGKDNTTTATTTITTATEDSESGKGEMLMDFPNPKESVEKRAGGGGGSGGDLLVGFTNAPAGELLVGFPSASAGEAEEEGEVNEEDAVEDMDFGGIAFDASFSNLDKAIDAADNDNDNAEGKKKKKRITKLFQKKKDHQQGPTKNCAEIVVDKSKIPTTKVAGEFVNGELVVPEKAITTGGDDQQKPHKERERSSGKGRFKSLTKSLKSKVGGGRTKENQNEEEDDDNTSISWARKPNSSLEPEKDQDQEDGSESHDLDNDLDTSKPEDDRIGANSRIRHSRRRRSVTGHAGGEAPASSSTDPRRRERRRESRKDGQKTRPHKSSEGHQDGAQKPYSRSHTDEHDVRTSKHRTSTTDRERGTRRQTVHGSSHSKTKSNGEEDRLGSSSKQDGRSEDGSRKELVDSSRTHRDSRSSREGRHSESRVKKPMRKSVTLGAEPTSQHKDALLGSGDAAGLRRTMTDGSALGRRAMSTRYLNTGKDLISSSQRDRTGGLSHRERLRRAPKSERHLLGKTTEQSIKKKEALGNLFGGGGPDKKERKDTKDASDHRRRRTNSDGEFKDDRAPIIEENEMEDETEREAKDESTNTGSEEELDKSDQFGSNEDGTKKSAADVVSSALSSDNLTKDDVEKLIRAVAHQAMGAKDANDLEAIVMGALKGGIRTADLRAKAEESASPFEYSIDFSYESQTSSGMQDDSTRKYHMEDESTKTTLTKKDIQDKTRNYVYMFLQKHGGEASAKRSSTASSDSEKRRWANYANAITTNSDEASPGEDIPRENADEPDADNEVEKKPSKGAVDFSEVTAKLEAKAAAKAAAKAKAHGQAKPSHKALDVETRVELVKAAKSLEHRSSKSSKGEQRSSVTKPDFAEVASKLEAKAEAKNRARMKAQVATAK